MLTKMKTLAAAVALAASGAAQATTAILFDPDGSGGGGDVISVSTFDWSPDNALAVGAIPLPTSPTTNTFTLYAQASLGNFLDATNNPILGTGLNSTFEITFQTGFTETGTLIAPLTAQFNLPALTPINFFKIYYDATPDFNQVTGTGYGDNDGNGTIDDGSALILSAIVIGNTTIFTVIPTSPLPPLDSHGADDQPGITTVVGVGGGALTADVFFRDANYFITDITQLVVDLEFNTSNVTPFNQADPSDAVVGNTPVYGAGGVNGAPCATGTPTCDFHFQADANMAFNAVPEPGSLLLLGIGLMSMVWIARRRLA